MEQTFGEQLLAKYNREQRVNQRMAIIEWLAIRWQNYRLLQEAALWSLPDQLIPINTDLAQRYYLSEKVILGYLQEAEKLGLVKVFTDSAGQSHAFQITHDEQSLAGELIKVLFQ
ncbi:hypothetical protein KSF_107690 [Reticulibacter mediterranei]|uniref:Uncharacterized protein n=1 Tax=Reticulibacter mediterranei TaxID=2778369 RepID=A0A8J3ITW0_9CHLR|nr:hypothetical protein [Reticulibacter mediterranei]GHP00722.1 hypothetical protein KSF_107690 [Reticulibacter mediterranei]